MQVQRMKSILVALTRFDEIPLSKLVNPIHGTKLANRYNFTVAEPIRVNDRLVIQYKLGLFEGQDEVPILTLQIEERKIVCEVEGSKDELDAFFNDLKTFMEDLAGNVQDDYMDPIYLGYESEIVVRLDIDATSLLSPSYMQFLHDDLLPKLDSEHAAVRIQPASVRFEVDFLPTSHHLADHRITLNRKNVVIQPRSGFPPEERVFVSKAPVDSELHLSFLGELEKIFSVEE